jgi:hypothetical protein
VTRSDEDARRILVELLGSEETPSGLREKCATSLEQAIGHDHRVEGQMISLLDDRNHEKLARIANQALAEALAEGRIPWDANLVSKIETHLTAVPDPCPHALSALQDLLKTR